MAQTHSHNTDTFSRHGCILMTWMRSHDTDTFSWHGYVLMTQTYAPDTKSEPDMKELLRCTDPPLRHSTLARIVCCTHLLSVARPPTAAGNSAKSSPMVCVERFEGVSLGAPVCKKPVCKKQKLGLRSLTK